ncbi:MAG TPA: Xaa-Pro peptidase family protein, partial [Ktedonobacterales bacterium]|nr:Xaa-Pro peptidase family protein [Ktedonobacterales bacterium]
MTKQTTTQKRLAAVRERMRAAGLDALLVSNPENRQYITGFYGHDSGQDSAGRVLITQDHIALMTDMRYSEQAHEEAPGVEIIDKREKLTVLVNERLDEWGWPRGKTGATKPVLGIEANHLTVSLCDALRTASRSRFRIKPTTEIVEPLRAQKDKEEIELTRRATDITCQTFDHLLEYLKQPGLTEQQVVAESVTTMLRLGADSVAFAAIVAGGPNGARPHAMPGDRVLEPYAPIIIDMGARVHGYCADMTRTVFLDGVPDVWAERYHHVLAAQEACEAGLRAGISGKV